MSASSKPARDENTNTVTDVWFFLRALDTADKPEVWPTNEPILVSRPSTKFIGCKLCTYVYGIYLRPYLWILCYRKTWKTWAHGDGMMTCYRQHLKKDHWEMYESTIQIKNLKHAKRTTFFALPLACSNIGVIWSLSSISRVHTVVQILQCIFLHW